MRAALTVTIMIAYQSMMIIPTVTHASNIDGEMEKRWLLIRLNDKVITNEMIAH